MQQLTVCQERQLTINKALLAIIICQEAHGGQTQSLSLLLPRESQTRVMAVSSRYREIEMTLSLSLCPGTALTLTDCPDNILSKKAGVV